MINNRLVKNIRAHLSWLRESMFDIAVSALIITDTTNNTIHKIITDINTPGMENITLLPGTPVFNTAASEHIKSLLHILNKHGIWQGNGKQWIQKFRPLYDELTKAYMHNASKQHHVPQTTRLILTYLQTMNDIIMLPVHAEGIPYVGIQFTAKREGRFSETEFEVCRSFSRKAEYSIDALYQDSEYQTLKTLHHEHLTLHSLRQNIFKYITDMTLTNEQCISAILETIGPAFHLSRVCYNTFIEADCVCVREWCAHGIRPSLGSKFPRKFIDEYQHHDASEITLDSFIEQFPLLLRGTARNIAGVFVKTLNLEKIIFLPIKIGTVYEGAITLDICATKKPPHVQWNETIRLFIIEIVKMIALRVQCSRAAKTVSEEENRYHRLFSEAPIALCLSTLNGKIIECNTAMKTITGYSQDDFIRISMKNIFARKKDFSAAIQALQKQHDTRYPSIALQHKNGTIITTHINCTLVFINSKKYVLYTIESMT